MTTTSDPELQTSPQKRYYEKNKEKYNQWARESYHRNKERCAVRAKAWRESNKEYVRTKQREDKRQRKLKAIEYMGGMCGGCNQQYHPAIYEFHHTDPTTKDRDPSKMLSLSWERLSTELDKCQLLCANCHRLVHHGDKY